MTTWYREGLITLTAGSDLVAGVGTEWVDSVLPGGIFFTPTGLIEVERVISDGSLKLVSPYAGPSVVGAEYAIAPTQGYVVELAKQFNSVLGTFGELKDAWQEGSLNGKGLVLKGVRNDVVDLPATGNVQGDGWMVDSVLYVWSGTGWVNQGAMVTTPELEALRDAAGTSAGLAVGSAIAAEATRNAYEDRVYPGVYSTPPSNKPHSGAASADGDRCTILVGGVAYEHLRSGGGWVIPNVDAAQLALPSGSARVGFLQSGLGAVARTLYAKALETVSITDFGGLCNGVADDTDAMEAALAKVGVRGHVELMGTPRFTRTIVLPLLSNGICVFAKHPIVVKCDHNGDGFDLSGQNENYGGNVLWNLCLQGPNVAYPGVGYVPPSIGAGIRMRKAYDNTLINVRVFGFLYGQYLRQGFNNKTMGDCQFKFNQIGIFVDGGATNLNRWPGAKIRENRVGGVLMDGGSSGPYPTQNSFASGYIESNIPYNGGYPVGGPGDGSWGFGIKLLRVYDTCLDDMYFENQEYDIWLGSNSSGGKFTKTRHAPSGDFSRLGKIKLSGAGVNNNTFMHAIQVSRNQTDVHVEADNASQFQNQFLDIEGFNLIPSAILSWANMDVRNNRPAALLYGTPAGYMARYSHGYLSNPSEGVSRGKISGIGTTNATLNAQGYGEIILGSQITEATTITAISNLKPGQLFMLKNYQTAFPVTVKSSTDGINGIVLHGHADAVLAGYSDSVTFFCSGLGKVVEIGRSIASAAGSIVGTWTPTLKNSSGSAIALSSASGRYVRSGRLLTVWFDVAASVDLADGRYYDVAGLPFNPSFTVAGCGTAGSATSAADANQRSVFSVDAMSGTNVLRVRMAPSLNLSNADAFAGTAAFLVP